MFREIFTYLTACFQSSYELSRVHHDHAIVNNVGKKAKIRNRYNQIPHLTKDTLWECDKYTRKHHIHESQEVSSLPSGDHKFA